MIDDAYWNELQISQYQSPPVPMRTSKRARSLRAISGESVASRSRENVCASNGGAAGAGSPSSWSSVTARGGAPPASGVGRNGAYGVLLGLLSDFVLMK